MITYPVDVTNDFFTTKLGGLVKRRIRWPRSDGLPLEGVDPAMVILKESIAPIPAYDPNTQRLTNGIWIDDEANQTAIFTRSVVDLDPEDIAAKAAEQVRAVKRTNVKDAVATLRTWSEQTAVIVVDSGNAINVLQQMVDHMSVFFARFADLIEGHGFDK